MAADIWLVICFLLFVWAIFFPKSLTNWTSAFKVLVVGCGNSELSEQLYDVGYKHLTNIDISETVVTHMNQRNAERRPGLTFQQIDATKTPYEDGSYQAALDKGTLDAMAAEEDGALARSMLTEVGNWTFLKSMFCEQHSYVFLLAVTLGRQSSVCWRTICLRDAGSGERD